MIFVVAVCACVSAAVFLRSAWERNQLAAEYYTYENASAPGDIRLVFLTDIHDRLGGKDIAMILGKTRDICPDLILIGGDVFTAGKTRAREPDCPAALRLLRGLRGIAPVMYAEGNHELKLRECFPERFERYLADLRAADITCLFNEHRDFDGIGVYGISLPGDCYAEKFLSFADPERKKALPCGYLANLIGDPDKDKLNVLLVHSPLYIKEAEEWGADLVLSGHFHGGTIRLPFIGGVMTPQFHFFLKENAGRFGYGDATMIVSRGIGTHSINLRLFDLPEITVIDIKKAG